MATKNKKTTSKRVATTVSEFEKEFDDKKNTRKQPLRPGSKLLGKQVEGTSRTLITTPILTNRPVNAYIERVVDHESGASGLWLWHTTEQSEVVGMVNLVEINNSTLQEIFQGQEWSIPYTKKDAEKIAANSFGKTNFMFKDGNSKTIISREAFLEFKVKPI